MNKTLTPDRTKAEPSAEKRTHDRILALAISLLKSPKQCANPEEISKILDEICLIFPSNKAILDNPQHAHGSRDCFDFLKAMDRPALRELLQGEEPGKIALVSFFFTRNEMSKLIAVLDSPLIVEILLQMGKISKVTFHSIKHTAIAFAGQLKVRSLTLQKRDQRPKQATPPPFRGIPAPTARKTLPTPPRQRRQEPQPDSRDFEMVRILS